MFLTVNGVSISAVFLLQTNFVRIKMLTSNDRKYLYFKNVIMLYRKFMPGNVILKLNEGNLPERDSCAQPHAPISSKENS